MQTDSSPTAGPAERTIPKTGAQIIVDALRAHGIETIFGYIGASVLPLFDRLYDSPIRFVVPCHEQGACHMADAYARASGRVGVVIATSGPGACNLVTGLATAVMDSIPLVALTGQVRTDLIGDDAFQEAPTTGITRAVTKHNSIVGDAKVVLAALAELVEHRERSAWFARIADWKRRYAVDYDRAAARIKPQYVVEELCRQTEGEAVITTGVGQHQMFAAQFYKFRHSRQLITSGGLGTMGFGLPAAIGAQIARPDALVIDIDGDHSFNMTMAELSTAVQHELPIKICILNNGFMGMVRQWQELFYHKRYAYSHLRNPDYAEFARAVGAVGITAQSKDQVGPALGRMLREDKPCVVDFHVEAEENVWPMVPAGKSLDEMQGLEVLQNAM